MATLEGGAASVRMDRRTFLKAIAASVLVGPLLPAPGARATEDGTETLSFSLAGQPPPLETGSSPVKDYLYKIRNPDTAFADDIVLAESEKELLRAVLQRLERLCAFIGDGNFATLSFDGAVQLAKRQVAIGRFTGEELAFMDMVYNRDAKDYGFFGAKQVTSLTQYIDGAGVIKVPHSGNYLFKGESLEKFEKIKEALGEEVVLTSGIRGIIKQFYLFLAKADRHGGNLSLASRSLAPPGYSYHAVGDFDIGQRGFGEFNFTTRFTSTPVYKRAVECGYIDNRYWRDNPLGVRYEPWHIKL